MGTGTLILLAGGAFLLLRGGGLTNLFGGTAPAGFTAVGGGYYRGPDGRYYTRSATGQMVPTTTSFTPTGVTWLDRLLGAGVQAGVQTIPAATSGLVSWIGGLFTTSPASATTPLPPLGTAGELLPGGGYTVTAPDILSGVYYPPLPPLEPLPNLTVSDWMSVPIDYSAFELSGVPTLPDLSSWGFMGLGDLPRRPGFSRTLRRPPSYR